MKKTICNVFGHKWKYNSPAIFNKAICSKCKGKKILDLHTLKWSNIDKFENEKRSDDKLIDSWF